MAKLSRQEQLEKIVEELKLFMDQTDMKIMESK